MCWYEFSNHGMSGWAFFLILIPFVWDIIFCICGFISNVDKFVITIWTFYHGYRKEWKPGFKECAMLRRQMYIPQSTQRYVNVLSNESVIKGLWQKSLYWKLQTLYSKFHSFSIRNMFLNSQHWVSLLFIGGVLLSLGGIDIAFACTLF